MENTDQCLTEMPEKCMNAKDNIIFITPGSNHVELNTITESPAYVIKRVTGFKDTLGFLRGNENNFIVVHNKELNGKVPMEFLEDVKKAGAKVFALIDPSVSSKRFEELRHCGVDDFVASPLNIGELHHRIDLHKRMAIKRETISFLKKGLEGYEDERPDKLLDMYNDLQMAYKEMDLRKRELESLDKAKSDFIQMVSHEIRTPLNAILGFSELLKLKLPQEYNQYMNSLGQAAIRLQEFSNKAILVSQLKTNKYKIHKEPVSILYIVNSILEKYRDKIAMKNLTIRNNIAHRLIHTDFKLCEKALANTLENALRYAPENSNVYLEELYKNEKFTIMVIDEGPGFSDEVFSNIFGLFVHGEKYVDKNVGMGLYMVKLIMNYISGSVKVANNKDGGALVKLVFPT
jgi:two-component system, sensor histidine kinase and response regulator